MLQPILIILPWLELYLRSRRPIIRRGAPPSARGPGRECP